MTTITKKALRAIVESEPTLCCKTLHRRTAFHRVRNVLTDESIIVRTSGRALEPLVEVQAALDRIKTPDSEALEVFEARRLTVAGELRHAREALIRILEEAEDHFEEDLKRLGSMCYHGPAQEVSRKANSLTSLRATCWTLRDRVLS